MAGGYDRSQPARKVVQEIISNGNAIPSGITGLSLKQHGSLYQSWATPLPPSSSARVLALTASSSTAAVTVTTGLTNPDYPRAVKIAPSTSHLATTSVVINGTNQWGATAQDTVAMNGSGTAVDGSVAFKTITSVVLPASTSQSCSYTIGLSNKFGLMREVATVAACIRGAVNGTAETTAPIINKTNHTASFTTAATSSAGALVEVVYLHSDVKHS